MPRISEKIKVMKFIEEKLIIAYMSLEIFGPSEGSNSIEQGDEVHDEWLFSSAIVKTARYCSPIKSVPKSQHFFYDILPSMDENRFRQFVRVNWKNFYVILNLIRNDEVFQGPRSCRQFPVELQLAIVLSRLGSSGEGASVSKIACLFGVGDGGTLQRITERIFKAILKNKDMFLFWPDTKERLDIVSSTCHELPHCIGYVDGTEIKLAEKPLDDPESYFSRKHIYSLKVQAVCDFKLRVRHMVLGYPGSVHDSRIYNNCELFTKVSKYFSGAEWLAADSAYKLTNTVISPFRSNSNDGTPEQRNNFYKRFSKYRVRIENCFGSMKERFNSLKELKIQIKNDSSVKFACRWVLVCAILHNIILNQNNEDNFDFECIQNDDDEAVHSDDVNEQLPLVEGEVKRRALLEVMAEIADHN